MKAMLLSDFMTMRRTLGQLLVTQILITAFLAFTTNSLAVAAACAAAMLPAMYIVSVGAYDEANKWEEFRLTLPLTRTQVVLGRYAGVLLLSLAATVVAIALAALTALIPLDVVVDMLDGESFVTAYPTRRLEIAEAFVGSALLATVFVLLLAAVMMPLLLRFGLTRGVRVVPVVMGLLCCASVMTLSDDGFLSALLPQFPPLLDDLPFLVITFGALGIALVLYVLSAAVAVCLYRTREF